MAQEQQQVGGKTQQQVQGSQPVQRSDQESSRSVPSRFRGRFDEMDRLFDRFLPQGWQSPMRWEWPQQLGERLHWERHMPRVDVIDRDDEIVIRAEVPGVDKKDIEVSTSGNTVTIKGSTGHEEKEERGDYFRCEISRGAFTRTVALPDEVDADKAKASFKDGLLELTMPKVEKAKRRTIPLE